MQITSENTRILLDKNLKKFEDNATPRDTSTLNNRIEALEQAQKNARAQNTQGKTTETREEIEDIHAKIRHLETAIKTTTKTEDKTN